MDLDNKEFLEKLLTDKDALLESIVETKGFVLHKLKKFDLLPDINTLVENLNVFNVQFITDNYKLDRNQQLILTRFLSEDSVVTSNINLSEEQIKQFLRSEEVLPPNTLLSLEILNEFPNEIEKQRHLDGTEIYDILKKSFKKLTIEQVMALNPELLKKEYYLMDCHPSYFQNQEYSNLYKKLVFENHPNPHVKDFSNYHFREEDKDFLYLLLKNSTSRFGSEQYTEYSFIDGFTNLISKLEYFEKFNNQDLSLFTERETERNVDAIRSAILKDKHIISSYEAFSELIRKKMSFSQFSLIIDEKMVQEILLKTSDTYGTLSRFFGHNESGRDHSVPDKKLHIAKLVLKLYSQNFAFSNGVEITDLISPSDIGYLMLDLSREKTSYQDEEIAQKNLLEINESIAKIYQNILPKFFHTKNLSDMLNYSKEVFNSATIGLLKPLFIENASVNSFLILSQVQREFSPNSIYESKFKDLIEKTLIEIHGKLLSTKDPSNLSSMRTILEYFVNEDGDKKGVLGKLLKSTPKSKSVQKPNTLNLLMYQGEDLIQLPESVLETLYEMQPEFSQYVLKNKLLVHKSLINHCLYRTSEQKNVEFLKKYVKIHRQVIEQDNSLVSALLASSYQSEIYPLSSSVDEKDYYVKIVELMKNVKILKDKRDKLSRLYPYEDFSYHAEDELDDDFKKQPLDVNVEISSDISLEEAKKLYVALYTKTNKEEKEIDVLKSRISYGFMEIKIKELIKSKNFEEIKNIYDYHLKFNQNPLVDYLSKISFAELKDNIKDPSFVYLLEHMIDYDRKSDVKFPTYSYEENFDLAVNLLKVFNAKGGKENYKFLYFFDPANRNFIKEFAIQYLPKSVLYSYDFMPESYNGYKPSKLVRGEYSNEDLYAVFKNLENQGGIFSEMGPNADFKNLFIATFFPEKRSNKEVLTDNRLDEFLNFIKDKDEMLYAMMASSQIIHHPLKYGRGYGNNPDEKFKTRDEAINNYFTEKFDFDKVLRGLKKITEIMNNPPSDEEGVEIINRKVAGNCIVQVIHNTYYEDYDDQGRTRCYESVTSDEDTIKLMKFLYENAPMYLIERHVIGKASEPVTYFKENIDEFADHDKIKNFILPQYGVQAEYLNLHQNSSQLERLTGFVNALVDNAVEKFDHKTIEYLIYTLNHNKFLEKEVKYRLKSKAHEGKDDLLLNFLSKDDQLLSLLEKAKLKMTLDESLVSKDRAVKRRNKV